MVYDAFISYRRKGGSELAEKLYKALQNEGIATFWDRRELKFVDFKRQLVTNNLHSRVLVVLLTKDSLDYKRCSDKDDWLRKELKLFLKLKKKIIFIKFDGFELPDRLPSCLKSIRYLLKNPKNVIDYCRFTEDEVIKEVISRVTKGLSNKDLNELKGMVPKAKTKPTIGVDISGEWGIFGREVSEDVKQKTLVEVQSENMKKYRKSSIRKFSNNAIYFVVLILICSIFFSTNIDSHIKTRVILLMYSLFVMFFKQYDGLWGILFDEVKITLHNIVFSLIKASIVLLLETIVVYLLVVLVLCNFWPEIFTNEISERIWAFILTSTSSLLSLFIVYEFIKSLLHFINAHASIYYSKMINRRRRISLFGDDIVEIRYETRGKEIKWAGFAVIICIIVAVVIELFLIKTIPFYWT